MLGGSGCYSGMYKMNKCDFRIESERFACLAFDARHRPLPTNSNEEEVATSSSGIISNNLQYTKTRVCNF